ncbi:unnamed protein product [Adineta steineri]|uniref:F-box domain-containing protein n=1 Tax=Adineta steineri TaxID=433720 RepID=A0A818ZBR8_9BILA|nr:unnamed protein product [Adineta steineri]CAF3761929.1 unnamed protein product [Adineta steineri]
MGCKKSKQQVNYLQYNIENPTTFEDLSNEVIYELFDYLSYYDITCAFGKLNERLQHLIDTYSHYVNLQQHTKADTHIFPQFIYSLRISASYQFSFIDFSCLSSVHNLILSNLSVTSLLYIFNTLSLKNLEYIYVSSCPLHNFNKAQLGEVQTKILSLGEFKLKKCVFRMELYANIDMLPAQLYSLEYIRIGGCKNILTINSLLDRMPNLISFHVFICESLQPGVNINKYAKRNDRIHCLTNLTLRVYDLKSKDELTILFTRHCSNVKKLIIYLEPMDIYGLSFLDEKPDDPVKHLQQWVRSTISPLLPQLTNFHLRQTILREDDKPFKRRRPPYIKEIPCLFQNRSYRVSIDSHLKYLW